MGSIVLLPSKVLSVPCIGSFWLQQLAYWVLQVRHSLAGFLSWNFSAQEDIVEHHMPTAIGKQQHVNMPAQLVS